ncbi:hypothetical protein GGX14DRAFT_409135 [Mycena pura]|uniref:Uncharacterized protein n=1 Tax=Mycena pura TaxID=153505 RepID=A0AAD6UKF4_9AGAR|nr:hypothetical protein GGX14DRAFT_409135 [Mycena pura]
MALKYVTPILTHSTRAVRNQVSAAIKLSRARKPKRAKVKVIRKPSTSAVMSRMSPWVCYVARYNRWTCGNSEPGWWGGSPIKAIFDSISLLPFGHLKLGAQVLRRPTAQFNACFHLSSKIKALVSKLARYSLPVLLQVPQVRTQELKCYVPSERPIFNRMMPLNAPRGVLMLIIYVSMMNALYMRRTRSEYPLYGTTGPAGLCFGQKKSDFGPYFQGSFIDTAIISGGLVSGLNLSSRGNMSD